MSIDSMYLWHLRARPEPTSRDFDVQLGCHLEEVAKGPNYRAPDLTGMY